MRPRLSTGGVSVTDKGKTPETPNLMTGTFLFDQMFEFNTIYLQGLELILCDFELGTGRFWYLQAMYGSALERVFIFEI